MKNRILRSALSVALCAAMLLSQGLTAFADGEIDLAAAKSSPVQESSEESEAKTPAETLTPETKKELPASTEDETKTETTTGQPTAEDDTAKETTAKTPAVVSEEEKSEESTAAPAEAQAATNSLEVTCNATKPILLPSESDVIVALPGFSFDCENSNCNAFESFELNDLVFTIGEVKSTAGTVDITFDNAAFSTSLAKFNKEYGKHNLAKEGPIVVTLTRDAEKGSWYYADKEQNIIVPVECSFPSNNVPAVPTYKDLEELLGNMAVTCVNPNHNVTETYDITWDSIGGLDKAPTANGNGTYSLEITVSHNTYLTLFNQTYPNHKWATDDDMENEKVTLIWKNGEWSVKGKTDFSFNVLCDTKAPVEPTKPESDVLDPIIGSVSVKCVTNEKHTSSWSYLTRQLTEGSDYTIGELGNENGKVTCTITYIAKAFADKYNELQTNIDHFPFNDVAVKLVWNDETSSWELENKNLLNNVLVSVGCVLSEEEILADNLSVMVDCISDLNHEDLTGLSLEKGTFSIDEPYQIAGEYFFDIEVQPDSYLKKYAEEHPTYPEHSGNAVKLTYQWKDTNWEPTISEISFKVTCEGPNIPSHEDVIKLLGGTMTVHCVNTNHNATETYGITWDSIGGLNKAPTDNGDGTYSLEITVSHDTYLKLFNQTYPNHKWATDDDMENEKVTLIWKDGEWIVEGETNFAFKVECHTPSTESLWGWNNGKEVIITCVEENALHTKGMTLSLVGVNGDKYWKFDPITWDQEQKCYTTTVTLEPDKYLEVYSGQYGEHALVSDHEDTVLSLKLSYQDGNGKWISNGDKFYLFVKCNAPSKPTIEDLDRLFTNNTKVNISCEKNKHADKLYPVKDNSVDRLGYLFIGPVEVDDNNHYTAKISLNDAFFINLYNQEEGGDHSLVSKTYITLSYDGEKWVFNDESKLDFDVVVTCPDNDNPGGGEDPGTNPGGGDNGNNGGNNNGGSTGGGSSVSRRDDDDDWEPLPNNNYRVTKKNDKPSQNTQIVVRDPADNSDNTSSNTGSDSGKHNPETGDTTTAFAAMALAAVSLGGVVLLGRKKK